MRTFLTTLAAVALFSTHPESARAETRQVWDSPAAAVEQTVGITDIAIKYHRPGVKGREIWGKLVPYGQIWRAGANEATTISFSTPVKVAGKSVPAGTYALFLLPQKDKWTFILSKDSDQWGAYSYKPADDLMRFDSTPGPAMAAEWLAFGLDPLGKNTVVVSLHWDKVQGSFPVEVDVNGQYDPYLVAELAKADASTNNKERFSTYLAAAKYWIQHDEKFDDAKKALDKAEKISPHFRVDEWRARLLAKQGKVAAALPLLAKAKAEAAGKAPQEYGEGLDKLRAEWAAKK